jgi:hypothetical protein
MRDPGNVDATRAAFKVVVGDRAKDNKNMKHELLDQIVSKAIARGNEAPLALPNIDGAISLEDFYAYMPTHSFIYVPSREMWSATSIDARIAPIDGIEVLGGPVKPDSQKASRWLASNRPVEQMTWAPGLPMLIENRLISEGGWIDHHGVRCFNLYRPPTLKAGEAGRAILWVDHVRRVFPAEAEHIFNWLAHGLQRPEEKINHALVLGGSQGIGKDTLLEPVKRAIGPWNFTEVGPQQLLGRFNGFVKSVILRVSEARDLGDVDRYSFYDHMKVYTAAPPDVLRVDEKHLREYSVLNCVGVIITTNHKSDGIFLPDDDRRHYVAWSDLTKDDFSPEYWNRLYSWYNDGGDRHVAAFLAQRDLSSFNPKAPPPKTNAFLEIVNASRAPEDAELADVLEGLGWPKVVTLARLQAYADAAFAEWLKDRRNRRTIPHRLEDAGYVPIHNRDAKSGLWKLNGKQQAVYGQRELTERDRIQAVRELLR